MQSPDVPCPSSSVAEPLVLLVLPAGAGMEREAAALEHPAAGFRTLRAATVAEARLVLASEPVELVVAVEVLPDGTCFDLHEADAGCDPVLVALGAEAPGKDASRPTCYRLARGTYTADNLSLRIWEVLGRHFVRQSRQAEAGRQEHRQRLEALRSGLSKVHHDINNPLSIISGNAQLLLELMRAMEIDDDLLRPVQDIEEAGRRVADLMGNLLVLKQMVPRDIP